MKYERPYIIEEEIFLEDIISVSLSGDNYDGDITWGEPKH